MNVRVNPGKVCYRTLEFEKPWSLDSYLKVGGYSVWQKILKEKTDRAEIIDQLKKSGLRGRGGAGFSTGIKWSFMNPNTDGDSYLVCNSDEGEPGTCKDHEILLNNPHQLIEGMLIACYTMGLNVAYNYLRGEFVGPHARCDQALVEAREKGFVGKNILSSGIDIEIHNILGAGSYIVGEETAMIESIEGKAGKPRNKPLFLLNAVFTIDQQQSITQKHWLLFRIYFNMEVRILRVLVQSKVVVQKYFVFLVMLISQVYLRFL